MFRINIWRIVLALFAASPNSAQADNWRVPRSEGAYVLLHGASKHYGDPSLQRLLMRWGYLNEINPGLGIGFYLPAPDWMGAGAEMSVDLSAYRDTWAFPAATLKSSLSWPTPLPNLRAGAMVGINWKSLNPWSPQTVWPITMGKLEYRFSDSISTEVLIAPYMKKFTDLGLITASLKFDLSPNRGAPYGATYLSRNPSPAQSYHREFLGFTPGPVLGRY
jgi:hypothetical protein